MMRINRIFLKVFALCITLIVLTIGLQLGLQYFFLDDYYERNIVNNVSNAMQSLKTDLVSNNYNKSEVNIKLDNVAYRQGILLHMARQYDDILIGVDQPYSGSTITIAGDNGGIFVISIDGYDISESNVLMDSTIMFKGYKDQINGVFYPYWINIDGVDYEQDFSEAISATSSTIQSSELTPANSTYSEEVIEVRGKVLEIAIVNQFENQSLVNGFEYQYSKLQEEMMNVLYNQVAFIQLQKQGVVHYQKTDSYTGNNNIFFMTTLKLADGNEYLLMGISELAPIQATASISMEFSMIVSIVGLLVAIVVSLVFSKGLTKPIVHIGEITSRMSNLDFEKKCSVKSKDEIGDLAININTMSQTLESNINQLHQANKKLQDDIDEKERLEVFRKQFIADASHELKTPITIIKGIGEGMVDGVYQSDDTTKVRELLEQADHMQNVVYELLSVSRIESEDINARFTIFQLDAVIQSVVHRYQPFIRERDIAFEMKLEEGFVRGDEPLMEMVISNIINNAIKYTPKSGKVIFSSRLRDDEMEVTVSNTPAFIPEHELDNVWTAFYRIEKSRNRQFGGTGLGLYTVREILRKHNIEPSIKNKDKGVEVSFTIPVIREEHERG